MLNTAQQNNCKLICSVNSKDYKTYFLILIKSSEILLYFHKNI